LLNLNVRDNHRTNVQALHVAAGSAAGTQRLNLYKRRGTNSLYERDLESRGSEDVRVVTVDSLLADLGLTRLDFMKVDVEGSELEVLKGAMDTLAKYRPSIAMETHSFGSPNEVVRMLEGLSYEVKNTAYRQGSGLGLLYASGR
jgi:FkbM family methyltransferase